MWWVILGKADHHTINYPKGVKMPGSKRGREYAMKKQRDGMSEKKYFDGTISRSIGALGEYQAWIEYGLTDSSNGGATTLLFAPTQGNQFSQRTGRKCWISDIKMRGQITWNTTDAAQDNNIQKIVLVLLLDMQVDKQAAGAWSPNVYQQLLNTGNSVNPGNQSGAFENTTEFGRYRVLKRKEYYRPTKVTADTTWNQVAISKVNIKHKFIKPLLVNYGELTTGDTTNVVDNGIRFMVIADGESGTYVSSAGEDPALQLYCRTGYFDHKARTPTGSGPIRQTWSSGAPRTYGYGGYGNARSRAIYFRNQNFPFMAPRARN